MHLAQVWGLEILKLTKKDTSFCNAKQIKVRYLLELEWNAKLLKDVTGTAD